MQKLIATSLLVAGLCACSTPDEKVTTPVTYTKLQALSQAAPMAAAKPFQANHHGYTLADNYHWLKDPGYPEVNDPEVLDYLQQENAYYQAWLTPHRTLVDTLFEEFKGRVDEQETSVPWQEEGYEYRWEYRPGENYKTWLWRSLKGGEEQVLLSETELAKDHDYFDLGDWEISPDHKLLAYSINTTGDERYQVFIKDLHSGEVRATGHLHTAGDLAFSADSQSLIYGQLDAERWWTASINAHRLGTSIEDDKILYKEADTGFFIGFSRSSSRDFLLINSSQRTVNETWAIALNDLSSTPLLLKSRNDNFYADIDHANGYFFRIANDQHVNGRLQHIAQDAFSEGEWHTLVEGNDELYIRGYQLFSSVIALQERFNGIDQIRLLSYDGTGRHIPFPETLYQVSLGNNPDYHQQHVRLNYESMVTPKTVYDYVFTQAQLVMRKQDKIPSGYDSQQYVSERVMAPTRDGKQVPVLLAYRKDTPKDGSAPLAMTGYGAYGLGYEPNFSTMRLSLLDRGFIFAIAQVRGGDDMGYQWYLDGKLGQRHNTFNDFIDATEHLIAQRYTSAGNISISGGSAGGELMGAAIVQAPHLWRSVILAVPFVDVLNTMLDASLPLTPPEWAEWGNPIEDKAAYEVIASYSPYDHIQATDYPPMMVTGGLNDPRVTYWEPAKWTAKMRALKTDNHLLVMRMNMGAGHFANSGRYGRLKDYAEEYAFQLLAHGIEK